MAPLCRLQNQHYDDKLDGRLRQSRWYTMENEGVESQACVCRTWVLCPEGEQEKVCDLLQLDL